MKGAGEGGNSSFVFVPGGTHILRQMGMCRSNGSFFYKKSLNMGPIFTKKKKKKKLRRKPRKSKKIVKNGPISQDKSLTMGTLFCQNDP